jgi:hypothetical protein
MNKFLFVILFFNVFVFSQEFKFDKQFNYTSPSSKDIIIFSNSQNGDYVLKLRNDFNGLYAHLEDFKTKLTHRFSVDSIKLNNNEYRLLFKYEYSMLNQRTFPINYFEYKLEYEDANYSYGSIYHYINKKKKKLFSKIEIKVLKTNENYFYIFRYLFFHPFEFTHRLNLNINGILQEVTKFRLFKSGKEINESDYFKGIKLILYADVDFSVSVPKKRSYKY